MASKTSGGLRLLIHWISDSVSHCDADGVHHAVVAHSDAPFLITAFQLLAARRTRIGGEFSQAGGDAGDQGGRELF